MSEHEVHIQPNGIWMNIAIGILTTCMVVLFYYTYNVDARSVKQPALASIEKRLGVIESRQFEILKLLRRTR